MRTNVDATYITNTLSYIHLLTKNEQIEHYNKVLHYFNVNSKRSRGNTAYLKLINKAIYSDIINIFKINKVHM